MMSPTFSPEDSSIPREIVAIRQEISLIDSHRTAHMTGLQVRQADKSCKYCQPYLDHQQPEPLPSQQITGRTPLATVNDLERTVEVSGKKGQITVPRSWAGKRVRVTLV
jgi:hypothetical protein